MVSYIGQKTQELPIYSSVMNFRLEEDAAALEEVVVVGYGKLASSLNGKVAGVSIRGSSSIPKKPLHIIDGIPMDGFTEGDLDKNEIQSIETLKGAGATAIYGNRGNYGVVVITTKKSTAQDAMTTTRFMIKNPYTITSDGDVTSMEINTFHLNSTYEYFAAPVINENVFLTANFSDWEKYNLLPGEASVYFMGSFAGKTTIDPYTVQKEMTVSLGIDPNITVTRKQDKNFKSRSFFGNNRILDRKYDLKIKNNKPTAVTIKLMDRIPLSQNNAIKVDDIKTFDAEHTVKKGLLSWKLKLAPKGTDTKSFSFRVKYPKGKSISL